MKPGRKPTRLTYRGKTRTLIQWARALGLTRQALQARLARGLPLREALAPKKPRCRKPTRFLTYQGETLALVEWARRKGIPYRTLYRRVVNYRLPAAQALASPRPRKAPAKGKRR